MACLKMTQQVWSYFIYLSIYLLFIYLQNSLEKHFAYLLIYLQKKTFDA